MGDEVGTVALVLLGIALMVLAGRIRRASLRRRPRPDGPRGGRDPERNARRDPGDAG